MSPEAFAIFIVVIALAALAFRGVVTSVAGRRGGGGVGTRVTRGGGSTGNYSDDRDL